MCDMIDKLIIYQLSLINNSKIYMVVCKMVVKYFVQFWFNLHVYLLRDLCAQPTKKIKSVSRYFMIRNNSLHFYFCNAH